LGPWSFRIKSFYFCRIQDLEVELEKWKAKHEKQNEMMNRTKKIMEKFKNDRKEVLDLF